jgi:hypothetical protein
MSNPTERTFYRAQTLANVEVLFPSHDPKLIVVEDQNGKQLIRIISLTTGETLLEQAGVDNGSFCHIFWRTQKLLGDKAQTGLKGGASGDVEQKLRRENKTLCRQVDELHREKEVFREQLMEAKVELAEAKLVMANMRNEKLQNRIDMLEQERQGMNTPTSTGWVLNDIGSVS